MMGKAARLADGANGWQKVLPINETATVSF
jgi:hypothetical protein